MFTQQELDLIFEGLDAIKKNESSGQLMSMILGGSMAEDKDAFIENFYAVQREQAAKNRTRDEQIILLKAKLISMRDKAFVNELEIS